MSVFPSVFANDGAVLKPAIEFDPPISITTSPFGSLLFLSFDSTTGYSNVLLAQLHSPITKIQTVTKDIDAKEVHFHDGVIFLCGKGSPITFRQLTKDAVVLEPERLKTRQMILDKLHELGINADGNLPTLRKHIAQHLEGLRDVYKNKEFESN